ncbi:MAG: manganese efflux pump [Oscillospiraceae bacterium]|nr:manganese efflux pump [Oscillospiraceae bacterium]
MFSVLISAFLLSLSSCLDNIVVGIAYGMKKTKINFIYNLLIAIITSCGTLISMLSGRLIATIIPVSVAQGLGAAMIIIIGIYFILEYFIKKNRDNNLDNELDIIKSQNNCCEIKQNNCEKSISLKETIMLAFALTINNLGIGISASLAGVSIIATVILTFIISILTIILGISMGYNVIGRLFGKFASLVSGILMIILGIIEFF